MYNCPKCKQLMHLYKDEGAGDSYHFPDDFFCKNCNIVYVSPYINDNVNHKGMLWVDDALFYKGTFEECCFAFRLKIFI